MSKLAEVKFIELPKHAVDLPWEKIERKFSPARYADSFFGEYNSLYWYVDPTTKFVSMDAIQKYLTLGLITVPQFECLKKKKSFCPIRELFVSSYLFYKFCFYMINTVDVKKKAITKVRQDVQL
ncbi:MAG: hypothetical protein PVG30_01625 [Gammaproteobacteria bacterium]